MLQVILDWIFILFPFVGYYVTYVHYKWWQTYKPSPLIRHLLISSIAVDTGATIIGFLALCQLLNIELGDTIPALLVSLALVITLGVKVYRRFDLRALDRPDMDLEQRVETQNQREDRQFGEERRALELEHAEDQVVIAEAAVDAGYAEGVEAGRKEETGKQAEDREFGDKRRILERIHLDEE
jgi:hypothetical protein